MIHPRHLQARSDRLCQRFFVFTLKSLSVGIATVHCADLLKQQKQLTPCGLYLHFANTGTICSYHLELLLRNLLVNPVEHYAVLPERLCSSDLVLLQFVNHLKETMQQLLFCGLTRIGFR